MELQTIWMQIWRYLQENAPTQFADLNPGCTLSEIQQVETSLGFSIPASLLWLYQQNDGQRGQSQGIFFLEKQVSETPMGLIGGCRFLPIREMLTVWNELCQDKDLDVFNIQNRDIPFAKDRGWDIFCINQQTGEIFAMWTGGADIFLPREWQTLRRGIASSMEQFLHLVFPI